MARHKRYWAVVGSGPNKAAADEIRIKLSELCYKTISSDVIENKKHIDLSAEPLIIVCAAGNPEAVTGDVVKDTAIFKAHKSSVVVFADEGETRFDPDRRCGDPPSEGAHAASRDPQHRGRPSVGILCRLRHRRGGAFFREFRNELSLAMVEHDHQNLTLYERIADEPPPACERFRGPVHRRRNRASSP